MTTPCFHVVVADPDPEIATNDDWRAEMLTARRAKDLTQGQLGARVGTSQNIISLIETGGVGASQFIMPICRELEIPPPTFFEDEIIRAWWRLGRELRDRDAALFERALKMVESMVAAFRPNKGG